LTRSELNICFRPLRAGRTDFSSRSTYAYGTSLCGVRSYVRMHTYVRSRTARSTKIVFVTRTAVTAQRKVRATGIGFIIKHHDYVYSVLQLSEPVDYVEPAEIHPSQMPQSEFTPRSSAGRSHNKGRGTDRATLRAALRHRFSARFTIQCRASAVAETWNRSGSRAHLLRKMRKRFLM